MKEHSNDFKLNIKEMGKQIDNVITYGTTTLHDELYAVTPLFEANLLKSVMKQLNIESSVEIPLETVVNYKLGVLVNNNYEYLDFGNYVVYKVEKQEDKNTYLITCFDKMLYSMKDNEDLGVTYPITIRNYLTAVANKIGLTLSNKPFVNESLSILAEPYFGLEYTYRDILDEISQATASNIVINKNDELEVKYFTDTNDTINEEYLKDINVKFGEKYGPINSIVLSRSAGSDNVYLKDDESIAENGLCEIKISDNQIMNGNNRSDFLGGILNTLKGFYYYLNDFSSTGICYYDVCDLYNIQIGENIYKCAMLNDEINVKQGLEELIHTDMPKETETDYDKADKTDRRINQTTLIVDKQNQIIEGVITNVTEQNEKISRVTQTVDELNSKIGDVADITTSQETLNGTLNFTGINQSEPIRIEIHPTGAHISYLYPRTNLHPSTSLYMTQRTLKFTNTTTDEVFIYEIPIDLLYHNSTNYDEFILDYDSQTCIVNKRIGRNADGSTYILTTPQELTFTYPEILLTDGDYTVTLLGYNNAYLFVRLMAQNIYTTQFATKAELSSSIRQTTESIDLSVNQKLNLYPTKTEMNSAINITANEISSEVSKKVGNDEIISKINQSAEAVSINAGKINLNGAVTANSNFKINTDGSMEAKNGKFRGTISTDKFNVDTEGNTKIYTSQNNVGAFKVLVDDNNRVHSYIQPGGMGCIGDDVYSVNIQAQRGNTFDISYVEVRDRNGYSVMEGGHVSSPRFIQTSLESEKKNFEKLENALPILQNIDIYKYNLKNEKDTTKKHIGFVIGDNYNYSKEVTSEDNSGVETYSFISLCCKAIQEQQEQIKELEKKIEKLEKGEK